MSNYETKALDMVTREIVTVTCIDDYFGSHEYGYSVNGTQPVRREAFCERFAEITAPAVANEITRLRSEIAQLQEALQRIAEWSEAYPLSVFSQPDLQKARTVLEANGMTLDAIAAHCMRHAIMGVGEVARNALAMSAIKERGEKNDTAGTNR